MEELDSDLKDLLDGWFTFYQADSTHILLYTIPVVHGEERLRKRRMNWVWYWNYRWDDLLLLLSDGTAFKSEGKQFSVPPGRLSEHSRHELEPMDNIPSQTQSVTTMS